MMDVWSVMMFIVPLLIILTHTLVHIIDKKHLVKSAGYSNIRRGLMAFGQIVIPLLVAIFVGAFFTAGEIHMGRENT